MEDDPIQELAKRLGLELKRRPTTPIKQMIASGLGSLGGQGVGRLAGLGWVGVGLASLTGAIAGHLVATYRLDSDETPAPERRPY